MIKMNSKNVQLNSLDQFAPDVELQFSVFYFNTFSPLEENHLMKSRGGKSTEKSFVVL